MRENSDLPGDKPTGHVVELIARSLDEPLTTAERARVAAHLRECITCRIASDGLYEFDALMKRTHMAIPDDGFALRVLTRIETYERRRSRWEWLLTLLLLLIGSVAAASWLVINLAAVLNSISALATNFIAIAPVWLNALFVLARSMGGAPLLIYSMIVLALIYLWTRASGGLVPSYISK